MQLVDHIFKHKLSFLYSYEDIRIMIKNQKRQGSDDYGLVSLDIKEMQNILTKTNFRALDINETTVRYDGFLTIYKLNNTKKEVTIKRVGSIVGEEMLILDSMKLESEHNKQTIYLISIVQRPNHNMTIINYAISR